ncbi:MAG: hypothetical protein L0Z50_30010, partial [Verrucomicrobiales bacterium]|nr:hypothetical protein [Verrucomicrobiales bacterium]
MNTRKKSLVAFLQCLPLRRRLAPAPVLAGPCLIQPNKFCVLGLALITAFVALAVASPAVAQVPKPHPIEDIIRTIPAGVDPSGTHIKLGYLNATLPPYNADPNGIIDATTALQSAANAARDNHLVMFLPAGTYLVSDTIKGILQFEKVDDNGDGVINSQDDPLDCAAPTRAQTKREFPTQILGSRLGAGVTIRLKDNASGFGNANSPKPVFDFFAECGGVRRPSSESYNHTLRHVRIFIGADNDGAVGVSMGTAQGGLLEDVKVESVAGAPFFAGAYNVPGQGGGSYNFEVIGGQYGIYITDVTKDPVTEVENNEASRFVVMAGCRFEGQSVAGVRYQHTHSMVIAGCTFNEPAGVNGVEMFVEPNPKNGYTAKAVGLTIVDSVFALKNNTVAVLNSESKNVYLNNVYVANGVNVVRNGTVNWNPGAKTLVNEYAFTNLNTGEESATNLVDGALTKAEIKTSAPYTPALPEHADLQARHTWTATELPHFEDSDVVTASESLGAVGAGDVTSNLQSLIDATVSSPNKKVFIPKGIYNISTLTLRPETKLFGVSRYYTVLKSWIGDTRGGIQPLVTTDSSLTGTGSLSRMHLVTNDDSVTRNHILTWKLGKSSRVHSITSDDWGAGSHYVANKVYWVQGNGGGRWYSILQNLPGNLAVSGFKTLYVDGTTQPLSFYGWANDNSFAEIVTASNVRFFYFKTEAANNQKDNSNPPLPVPRSPVDPLELINATNVAVFGLSGNGRHLDTSADGAMLTVRDSEQVVASGVRITNKTFAAGGGYPANWFTVSEYRGANPPITVNPENYVNAFKRGTFDIAAFDSAPPPTPPPAPTGLTATAGNAQVSLSWTASSGATSYNVKRATVNGGPYTTIASPTTTSHTDTTVVNGTTYYYVVSAVNAAGESANSNQASATPAAQTTVTFTSIGADDGYVRESNETSNVGDFFSATLSNTSALRAGDDGGAGNVQVKAVVSFDTSSIPDGATIVSVTLKLRRGTVSGTNPFTTHGACYVDIKGGTGFGGSAALAASDFEAAADAVQVATLSNAANNGDLSTGSLNSTGLLFINKTGKTQFRVYFSLDDND